MTLEQLPQQLPTPIRNGVLILPVNDEITLKSGLIIKPDQNSKEPPRAIVMNIAEGVEEVSIGDTILYNQHAAKLLLYKGIAYFTINVNDVWGIIQN